MTKEELVDRVRELIAEKLSLEVEDITEESDLVEDLDADSLDLVDLIMAVEDEFGVSIADEDVEKIKTVGDIFKQLLQALNINQDSPEEEEE
ncbi:MAG: acyl carrier protein [Thermotogae bacterium]|nr:MAG: acyl carrier protein [Thermotogota bacterium]